MLKLRKSQKKSFKKHHRTLKGVQTQHPPDFLVVSHPLVFSKSMAFEVSPKPSRRTDIGSSSLSSSIGKWGRISRAAAVFLGGFTKKCPSMACFLFCSCFFFHPWLFTWRYILLEGSPFAAWCLSSEVTRWISQRFGPVSVYHKVMVLKVLELLSQNSS